MIAVVAVPVAPAAPGRLGEAIEPQALLTYLDELGRWKDARRAELTRMDDAALATPTPDAYAGDVGLALALWQSISSRYDRALKVWDSGRVARREREELSRLIWGRLEGKDAGAGGFAVSLVEACRMSDALAAQLRGRLALDPGGDPAATAVRLRALRAQRERARDMLVSAEKSAGWQEDGQDDRRAVAVRLADVDHRITDLTERAARGADVSGPLGLLEQDASSIERDLIVGASRRRDLRRDRDRAHTRRDELAARAPALRTLAEECRRQIADPPRFAVPDASVLGEVPTERAPLDAYLARLEMVAQALDQVEAAYSGALSERDALRGRLGAYRSVALAGSNGTADAPREAVRNQIYEQAAGVLMHVPTDLAAGRDLVDRYQRLVRNSPERGTQA